ncbi:MAG: HAD family phosphatase [Rhodobacteraceae bacterium]|nr:HAD family phosphatase [Paracoccaceae bacterium]
MTHIVFDIGNVLIAWDERAPFRDAFADDAAIDRFFAEVGFYAWNLEQDRGRSRAAAVAAIAERWPHHAPLLDRFFDRFDETIRRKVEGSWAVLDDLKAAGRRVFGLTNWGADTWPVARKMHPELDAAFEDVVVSGHEGLIKPDRRIYEVLTGRNDLSPETCLFIDDSAKNVDGARAAGWQAVQFTDAAALRADLEGRGLL